MCDKDTQIYTQKHAHMHACTQAHVDTQTHKLHTP